MSDSFFKPYVTQLLGIRFICVAIINNKINNKTFPIDIPAVHWVVHLDCPEDVTTYIHRAGRTARYSHTGHSLLVVTPAEEKAMLDNLSTKNISVGRIE